MSAAKQFADDRVRFHPVFVLILVAIAWGVVATMEGIEAALTFLPWALALAYPVLALGWVLAFFGVLTVALLLLPIGDAVDSNLERRRIRRVRRRGGHR